MLNHAFNVVHSAVRKAFKRRSPEWPKVRDQHLEKNPTCASCGEKKRVQVHHINPFHLDPALELDPANLISLCMGKDECHLKIGHGDDFKAYNPKVIKHAKETLADPSDRNVVEAEARMNRRYAGPKKEGR